MEYDTRKSYNSYLGYYTGIIVIIILQINIRRLLCNNVITQQLTLILSRRKYFVGFLINCLCYLLAKKNILQRGEPNTLDYNTIIIIL